MQVFRSAAIVAHLPRRPVSAKTLRMWCTPELILGVTTLSDEQTLLPHLIYQARQSGARIILAHAHGLQAAGNGRNPSPAGSSFSAAEAREALDRMARQLRWLGFTCEPVLLSGPAELEIPHFVRSCGVDRVLIAFEDDPDLTTRMNFPVIQQVLRGVDIPVCVIGRNAMQTSRAVIRNITLAVSAESRCEVALSFACRLAQEHRARLNVLHVARRTSGTERLATPQSVIAALPFTTWREAELFCPSEVVVREGEFVDEILRYCSSTQQDLIILCSPGETRSIEAWRNSVSYRTIAGALCPVIIARRDSNHAPIKIEVPAASETQKFSPRKEGAEAAERRLLSTKVRN